MKRFLLCGVAAIGLLSLSGGRRVADAYVVPVACVSCPTWQQHLTSWWQQAADMAQTISQGAQVVDNGFRVVRQGEAMYHAVTNIHDLGSLVGALGVVGIQNPLPVNPYALQSILNGTGGFGGMASSASGLYTGAMSRNMVYQTPNPLNWAAMQANQAIAAATGAQAAVLAVNQEIQQREAHVARLRAQIQNARTPALQQGISAQIAQEQMEIQRLHAQLGTVGVFSQNQQFIIQAQAKQQSTRSIDETLEMIRGMVGL